MNKIYVVKYSYGCSECEEHIIIFATTKKTKAIKYSQKYNKIVKKWREYYKRFESDEINWIEGVHWIKDEYVKQYGRRWNQLRSIGKCYWEEINIR